MADTISPNEFAVGLASLQALAKGQSGAKLNKAAMFHTPSDSNPGNWTGGTQDDVNEHEDHISANGTDVEVVRKALAKSMADGESLTPVEFAVAKGTSVSEVMPALMNKVAKGQKMTEAEKYIFKAGCGSMSEGMAKMSGYGMKKADDEDDMGDDEDAEDDMMMSMDGDDDDGHEPTDMHVGMPMDAGEIEPDAKKSFYSSVYADADAAEAIDASSVLQHITKSFASVVGNLQHLIKAQNKRIQRMEKSLAKQHKLDRQFMKSASAALYGMGSTIMKSDAAMMQQMQQPARAPRSQMQASGYVQRPFGGQAPAGDIASLSKSQRDELALIAMQKGLINETDVCLVDRGQAIPPHIQQALMQVAAGK